jgi:RimJ/RimL family protein N-acetyltransferase
LVDTRKKLLGVIWFGKKNGGITFAIRLFPPLRGKGYSATFLQKVMAKFLKSEDYKKMGKTKIWLKTHSDNISAIKLYTKSDWKEIEDDGKEKTFIYQTY